MMTPRSIPVSVMKWLAAIAAVMALSACGGSADAPLTGSGPTGNPLTGTFIDSPVEGIGYRTESIASGATDSQGRFSYLAGESVTFFIGSLDFPTIPAAEVVTPFDLAGTTDVTDPTVINIARLLQSLDQNGDPDDGITIPEVAAAVATQIDFSQLPADFEADALNFIANAGSVNVSLIPEADAIAHLSESVLRNELSALTAIGVDIIPATGAPGYVILALHEDNSLLTVYNDDSSTGLDPEDPQLGFIPQRDTGTWSLTGNSLTITWGQNVETVDIEIVGDSVLWDVDGDGQPEFTDTIAKKIDPEQLLGRYKDSVCVDCFVTFSAGNAGTYEGDGSGTLDMTWELTQNGDLATTYSDGLVDLGLVDFYFLSIDGGVLEYVSYEDFADENNPKMRSGTLTLQ
ncbi:MAG: hypothetical protein O6763_06025 [Gammaproteobacteria bacterium]|nr:hypothetical protein [Gammaproteobacteria bacterium]